jgi:uncharacterized protein YqeY
MTYTDKINEDIKIAMKARSKDRLEVLRAIKTAFTLARTEKSATAELSRDDELKILQRLLKQRKESADIYKQQNRPDLYEKEIFEAGVIEEYLPEAMSEADITAVVKAIIAETGATGMQDMGKVMGLASKKLAGQADGKKISEIVKKELS